MPSAWSSRCTPEAIAPEGAQWMRAEHMRASLLFNSEIAYSPHNWTHLLHPANSPGRERPPCTQGGLASAACELRTAADLDRLHRGFGLGTGLVDRAVRADHRRLAGDRLLVDDRAFLCLHVLHDVEGAVLRQRAQCWQGQARDHGSR